MIKHTLKALDHYDSLLAGHTYELSRIKGSRMIRCDDISEPTPHLTPMRCAYSIYPWQLQDGIARGKLQLLDDTHSVAMSCTAATQLCQSTPSGFLY